VIIHEDAQDKGLYLAVHQTIGLMDY